MGPHQCSATYFSELCLIEAVTPWQRLCLRDEALIATPGQGLGLKDVGLIHLYLGKVFNLAVSLAGQGP